MSEIPVISSILSPEFLLKFIAKKYEIDAINKSKILKTGVNHTYLMEGEESKYIFRVYHHNWRTEKEIEEELKWVEHLKANNIAVSYPIRDKNLATIQKISAPEGTRYGVLFSYAEGDKIRGLNASQCHTIGDLMGKMHNLSQAHDCERIQYTMESLTNQTLSLIDRHFPADLPEMQFIKNGTVYLNELFNSIDTSQLPAGLVHLDIWYDNFNIDEEENLTLFDFDFLGKGWLAYDLAYTIMQLFHTEPNKEAFEEKKAQFLAGYQKHRKLTTTEEELLPWCGLAVWIFYFGIQAQRYNDWSNLYFNVNYLKHYIGMVQNWLTYNNLEVPQK